jgi:hypothetical protein
MKDLSQATEAEYRALIDAGRGVDQCPGSFHDVSNFLECCIDDAWDELPSRVNASMMRKYNSVFSAVMWKSKLPTPACYAWSLLCDSGEGRKGVVDFINSQGFTI